VFRQMSMYPYVRMRFLDVLGWHTRGGIPLASQPLPTRQRRREAGHRPRWFLGGSIGVSDAITAAFLAPVRNLIKANMFDRQQAMGVVGRSCEGIGWLGTCPPSCEETVLSTPLPGAIPARDSAEE
jgi:hypothetical protein